MELAKEDGDAAVDEIERRSKDFRRIKLLPFLRRRISPRARIQRSEGTHLDDMEVRREPLNIVRSNRPRPRPTLTRIPRHDPPHSQHTPFRNWRQQGIAPIPRQDRRHRSRARRRAIEVEKVEPHRRRRHVPLGRMRVVQRRSEHRLELERVEPGVHSSVRGVGSAVTGVEEIPAPAAQQALHAPKYSTVVPRSKLLIVRRWGEGEGRGLLSCVVLQAAVDGSRGLDSGSRRSRAQEFHQVCLRIALPRRWSWGRG